MYDENAVITMPNKLVTARYKSSLNGERLLNLIFTKVDMLDYLVGNDVKVKVTTDEWKSLFHINNPSASLKSAINSLSNIVFRFEGDLQEYKILRSYEYDEGWLNLTIDYRFLSACV